MYFEVKCPACKAKMDARYDQKLTCPECGEVFTAPGPPAPKPVTPSPPPPPPPPPNPFDFGAKPSHEETDDNDEDEEEDEDRPHKPEPKKRKPGQRERDRAAARGWVKWLGILGSIFALTVLGCCGYGGYRFYTEQRKPPVPPFEEPPNPYHVGTQTNLREIRSVPLPASNRNFVQLVHAPNHNLLFARGLKDVWVYDLGADAPSFGRSTTEAFTDMSLSPDQSALFVADYGGQAPGSRRPQKPTRIHRFDLATRTWEEQNAPQAAYLCKAVDADRVLMIEGEFAVAITLNRWESKSGIRERSRVDCETSGNLEYDPRTGLIYHSRRGGTGGAITIRQLERNTLKSSAEGAPIKKDVQGFATGTALSQDGSRLYFGPIQMATANPKQNLLTFPEEIRAASRDVAFGSKTYYRADDGTRLGEFDFKTAHEPKNDPFGKSSLPPALHVSPDGMSVWVIDRDKNVVRQFALEGEQ